MGKTLVAVKAHNIYLFRITFLGMTYISGLERQCVAHDEKYP